MKDLSWLDLAALDGIEDEFASILEETIVSSSISEERNTRLCIALRKRIELLREIVNKQIHSDAKR